MNWKGIRKLYFIEGKVDTYVYQNFFECATYGDRVHARVEGTK